MRNRHQPHCAMGKGGDCCTCITPPHCIGCIEKEKRLTDAVSLIRRGVRMLNRAGWEQGETDDEWRHKASSFLTQHDQEVEYLRSLKEPLNRRID